MIYIGEDPNRKNEIVDEYVSRNGIKKVFWIGGKEVYDNHDFVPYNKAHFYVYFYRLLREIDRDTLLVIDECVRNQNRHELIYNCIRQYLQQTDHKLIFQQFPIIDTIEDFMILFDFDTRSMWKSEKFHPILLEKCELSVNRIDLNFNFVDVPTSESTIKAYAKKREKLFSEIKLKDPHTIPRNLYLVGGADKKRYITNRVGNFVARNQRLKASSVISYKDAKPDMDYTVVEFPHRFIDFCDFLYRSKQDDLSILVTDLKVDGWYVDRYSKWLGRLEDVYSILCK